jgi:hypothetical protein
MLIRRARKRPRRTAPSQPRRPTGSSARNSAQAWSTPPIRGGNSPGFPAGTGKGGAVFLPDLLVRLWPHGEQLLKEFGIRPTEFAPGKVFGHQQAHADRLYHVTEPSHRAFLHPPVTGRAGPLPSAGGRRRRSRIKGRRTLGRYARPWRSDPGKTEPRLLRRPLTSASPLG